MRSPKAGRNIQLLDFYDRNWEELEARWRSSGARTWLCDEPVSIICGFVLSVLIDTDFELRDRWNAFFDGKKVLVNENGSYVVGESSEGVKPSKEVLEMSGLGDIDVEVPDWFFLSAPGADELV